MYLWKFGGASFGKALRLPVERHPVILHMTVKLTGDSCFYFKHVSMYMDLTWLDVSVCVHGSHMVPRIDVHGSHMVGRVGGWLSWAEDVPIIS